MPSDNTGANPQAGNTPAPENQPQAGDPTNTPPAQPQAGDTPGGNEDSLTLERARELIKELRAEAAASRVAKKELADLKEAQAKAAMSEVDAAKADATKYQAQAQALQAKLVAAEVEQTARKLGVVYPDMMMGLIADKLQYDENGLPTNADEAIKAVLKARPALANTATVAGSPANPGRDGSGPQTFKESQLADPDFYTKNRAAILAAMREGRIIRGQ